MNKMVKDVMLIAAAGTAGFCAYKWMSPEDKNKLSREFHRTVQDINDVKDDMSGLGSTIRNTF